MSDNLPALYEELERIGVDVAKWAEVEGSGSTALVHVGSKDPEKVRAQMIEVRREARQKSKDLSTAAEKVRAEIRANLARQQGEMEARMKAAMAALAPLQEQVKRMEEGIWTVNLYLGTSEQIVTLREGQPAPIDAPIHMRTSVLAMDEEVAAFPEEDGRTDWQGMDYRDVESFDRWLTEDPEHLTQVLPEERGIVVFTPRRTEKIMHEDPLVNAAINEQNFESYWLIRNGESLYRMQTDFKVGRHLMPVTSQFTALFQRERYNYETGEHEMVEIEPGSREWGEAEKGQDALRKHYMRVALIVQGLIDRTEVLAPLHAAVNVMQQATYDSGMVAVVNDTEKAITTGREPYYDWIRRLNADLRPGMRIIGTFRGGEWEEDACGERYGSDNARLSPHSAERPPQNTLLLIEDRREFRGQKGLVVRYKRNTEVYDPKMWVPSPTRPGWGHTGGYKKPTRRASAIILPTDVSIIPFDLVTEAEMQEYLSARTERHAYADSFPLLQAAIGAKRAEREAEAPFRDLLTRVLADDNEQPAEQVEPHIDALVHRFKVGNKWHRPLVSMTQEEEAKALRLIRAEYGRIVRSGADDGRDAHAVKVLREHDPSIAFIGRLSSGRYVAFAPIERSRGEALMHPRLWVREHTTGKTARSIATREWVVPGVRSNKMTSLFEADAWADWDRLSDATNDLTNDEFEQLFGDVRALADRAFTHGTLAVEYDREKRRWKVYGMANPPDGESGLGYRGEATYRQFSVKWSRQDGVPTLLTSDVPTRRGEEFGDVHVTQRELELSYPGNRGLGSGIDAFKRSVMMPWAGRRRVSTFGYEPTDARPGVVWTVGEEEQAALIKHARTIAARNDERYDRAQRVRHALDSVEREQWQRKVAAIKAEFLADYPDEEMWEEKRVRLTEKLRADVRVTDDHHFAVRTPFASGGAALHKREGYRDLRAVLTALDEGGYGPGAGLTVRDAYRLAEEEWPEEVYASIADVVIGPEPVETEGDD